MKVNSFLKGAEEDEEKKCLAHSFLISLRFSKLIANSFNTSQSLPALAVNSRDEEESCFKAVSLEMVFFFLLCFVDSFYFFYFFTWGPIALHGWTLARRVA